MDTDLKKVEIVISWSRQDPVWGVRRKIRSKIDTPKKSPRYPPALLSTQGKSQTRYSSLNSYKLKPKVLIFVLALAVALAVASATEN